jgi:hypothetical protein
MPLGMDSTVVYAAKIAGKWRDDGKVYQSDIDRDSPYNTRKILGLPIGPVGNPGLSSLRAALQPAKTDYLYYVRNPARNDGAHNFYSTEAQFEQGVQALRDWEKQRDAALMAAQHKSKSAATQPAAPAQGHAPAAQNSLLHGQPQAQGPHSSSTASHSPVPQQHSSPLHTPAKTHVHKHLAGQQ